MPITMQPFRRQQFERDQLDLMLGFITVAETLNFAEAGKLLNHSASTISRQVAKLESTLKVRLLERSTRRVALTEAGVFYLREASQILRHITEVEDRVSSLNTQPQGLLRISVPVAFGRLHMTAAILDFMRAHENFSIEANYSDAIVDLVREGYDLAIRIGTLANSAMISRKLSDNRRLVVAAPDYISVHGEPKIPSDLARHNCLRFTHYSSGGGLWQLRRAGELERVEVRGDFLSDNSEAIAAAAVSGWGVGLVAAYLIEKEIRDGSLVHLMQDCVSIPEAGIFIIYPSAQYLPNKVRLFSDFLAARFRKSHW